MGEVPFSYQEPWSSTNALNDHDHENESFDVFLKVRGDVSLKVKRTDTIRSLKEAFCSKTGVHENLQELLFSGEHLEDGKTVADCGIYRDSTINLLINGFGEKRFIKIPSKGLTVIVMAKVHDTIQHIKSMVLAKQDLESEEFDLMYGGKFLETRQTLASLNIGSDSTLYLVPRQSDVISVRVLVPTKEIMTLQVKPMQKIGDVKTIVGSMTSLSIQHAYLALAGQPLSDSRTLASYETIQENSLLEMSNFFQIFVKISNGKTVTLFVCPSDTVMTVDARVSEKLGLPENNFLYLFSGKLLDAGQHLANYRIQKDSTLEARIRKNKCKC